jgi:hypothetical protein
MSRVLSSSLSLLLLACGSSAMAQSVPKVSTTASVAAFQGRAGMPGASLPALSVPRVNSPTLPRLGYARYPWKTDITATVFWVGEDPTEKNPTPNHKSSWDTAWMQNFGGFDDPDPARRAANFCPRGFTPGLNPFYVALPYNDCVDYRTHKPEAAQVIPWFQQKFSRPGKSVLKGTWVAIRCGNRVCYAQWEDCGPFVTDDHAYVFGNARPKNSNNNGAGIDVSPAVRDFLGMAGRAKCDWRFVDLNEVPPGPWRSLGMNNPFVRSQDEPAAPSAPGSSGLASRLEELRRQRDAYFRQNGNADFRRR